MGFNFVPAGRITAVLSVLIDNWNGWHLLNKSGRLVKQLYGYSNGKIWWNLVSTNKFNIMTSQWHQITSPYLSKYTKTLEMMSTSFYVILVALSRAVFKLQRSEGGGGVYEARHLRYVTAFVRYCFHCFTSEDVLPLIGSTVRNVFCCLQFEKFRQKLGTVGIHAVHLVQPIHSVHLLKPVHSKAVRASNSVVALGTLAYMTSFSAICSIAHSN